MNYKNAFRTKSTGFLLLTLIIGALAFTLNITLRGNNFHFFFNEDVTLLSVDKTADQFVLCSGNEIYSINSKGVEHLVGKVNFRAIKIWSFDHSVFVTGRGGHLILFDNSGKRWETKLPSTLSAMSKIGNYRFITSYYSSKENNYVIYILDARDGSGNIVYKGKPNPMSSLSISDFAELSPGKFLFYSGKLHVFDTDSNKISISNNTIITNYVRFSKSTQNEWYAIVHYGGIYEININNGTVNKLYSGDYYPSLGVDNEGDYIYFFSGDTKTSDLYIKRFNSKRKRMEKQMKTESCDRASIGFGLVACSVGKSLRVRPLPN